MPADGFYDAIELIKLNRTFIQKEVAAFVQDIFPSLDFNVTKCERDIGLILDAVTVDLEFGGNEESVWAARSYLTYLGTNIEGQVQATSSAVGYAKTVTRQIVRNIALAFTYQDTVDQIVDTDYDEGNDANTRIVELFDTIEDGISNGEAGLPEVVENQINIQFQTIRVASGEYEEQNPIALPPFTAVVGDSLRTVTVKGATVDEDIFHVTIGDYLSDMSLKDHVAPAAAIAFNPNGNTFLQRSVADWTSPYLQNMTSRTTTGTGMRVDGSVSGGLKSMVVDSFTQYNEGGIGVHLLNRGYAQLVSVFTICCQDGFLAESGGFCSITNSNSSFGTNGLRSTGVSETLYDGLSNGDNQSGRTVIIDGLEIRPNVNDAVKFAGDSTYYTVQSATSLFETVNSGGYEDAANLLRLNKTVIGTYVTDYIDTTYPNLSYDTEKCARDVGYIIDAIADDMVDGGVENSDDAARKYWSGTRSQVTGQISETADGIEQISVVVPSILAQTYPGQVIDGTLSAEAGAGNVVSNLVDDISNAITRTNTGQSTVTLEEVLDTVIADNTVVTFHQRSLINASAHTFEFIGSGNEIQFAVPYQGGKAVQEQEVIEDEDGGGRVNFTSTDQRGDFRIGQELVIDRATGTIAGRTFNRSLFAVVTPFILAITE